MYRGKYETKDTDTNTPAVPVPEKAMPVRRRRRKRVTTGTVCFYAVWLLLIVVFFIGISIAKSALTDWLLDFEASQPDNQSQKIFQEHFAKPDWAELYAMSGLENTAFEGVQAYVSYMDKTVGDSEITMVETSAGLSGGKKYVIRATLGEDAFFNFATFTLVDKKAENDLISDWQIGQVELFAWDAENGKTVSLQRKLEYRFLVSPDSTVTVNGVVLGEDNIYRTVATVAEEYLPEGVHGYRLVELRVDGLLSEPKIEIKNAAGDVIEAEFDPENNVYMENIPVPAISDLEKSTVLTAAQTYCQYMISAVGAWDLRAYFDHTTPIYTTITTNTTWMQGYLGFEFGESTVSDFYRYSDSLYSAKVSLTLNVTRKDYTVKVYELDTHFFLALQEDGWKVIEMTNVDVQEQTTQVRVEYVSGDNVLATQMVVSDSRKLTPPAAPVVEGQPFLGWFVEAGQLETAEDGTITLPTGFLTEPVTIYALYSKGAE